MTTVRHDLGAFALVPEWVVTSVSGSAVKMWAKLWIYTGNGTHDAWPSHDTLASDMGCSIRSVKRMLEELEQVGALSIRARTGTSNLYSLHWRPVDNGDRFGLPTQAKSGLSPRPLVAYEERQSEIDKQEHGESDRSVHRRTPGDAPLTREQIRAIRDAAKAQALTHHPKSRP